MFKAELGVKSTDKLTCLHPLLFLERDRIGINRDSILEVLEEVGRPKGPILCDVDVFKGHYQLEERRLERNRRPIFLGVLTVSLGDDTLPAKEELEQIMERLREVLSVTLRKGDLVTQWNRAQFIMNLPGLNLEQTSIALERVYKRFIRLESSGDLTLDRKVEMVLPRSE